MSDDSTLIRSYAEQHSEEAFRTLVERHFQMVYSTALRCTRGRHDLAEEVCQQVFTLLAREAGRLKGHPLLAGWLYRSTCHVAARRWRAEMRRLAKEQRAAVLREETGDAFSCVDWEALRPHLDTVLGALPDKDREALVLRFLGNRPYAELAQGLGVSEDAIRMRVDRALGKLRVLLERRGLRSTAEALAAFLAAQGALAAPVGLAARVCQSSLSAAALLPASASLGIFALMSTTKTTVAASLACLLSASFAVYEYNRASSAESSLLEASRREASLRRERTELESRLRETESQPRRQPGPAAFSLGAVSAGAGAKSQADAYADFLLANPEYTEISKQQFLASLPLRNGALYRRLRLSPEKIAAFEALLVEQHQLAEDMLVAARTKGLSMDDPQMRSLRLKEQDELVQKQRDLLGEEAWSKVKEYAKTESARAAVMELSGTLLYTASPLRAEQADLLENLIAANTPKAEKTAKGTVEKVADWTAIETAALSILSPEQFKALQVVARRERCRAQLSELLLRNAGSLQGLSTTRNSRG